MSYYHDLIPDFGLSQKQLEVKYDAVSGGEHPQFTRELWRKQRKLFGYWVWLQEELATAQDDLERDSPYAC